MRVHFGNKVDFCSLAWYTNRVLLLSTLFSYQEVIRE